MLCVTHLPQIACFADHHYLVGKFERNGRTVAEIAELIRRPAQKKSAACSAANCSRRKRCATLKNWCAPRGADENQCYLLSMDIDQAVQSAKAFASKSLGPERTANIRLEEIESAVVNAKPVWQITLSSESRRDPIAPITLGNLSRILVPTPNQNTKYSR